MSWDEAWYAEIARNILKSGNLFNLQWNGMPYYDHPPTGFWLIAVGEKLFGYSGFGVRVTSTVAGFLAVVLTYFLGKAMFNRVVGWCSAIALTSSFWFLFRARSGNLDIYLTFFFLLTFFTAWKARLNRAWLIPFSVSFVLLMLTKTGIPFTIVPALLIIFLGSRVKIRDYFLMVVVIGFTGWFWLHSQLSTNSLFFQRYFQIGLPGVGEKTSYWDNFALAKTYLHDGIGKWFWPGVLGLGSSLVVGVIRAVRGFREKQWLVFPVFFVFFFGPFILTNKGHIWHLIPLHPFMILSFFSVAYWVGEKLMEVRVFRDIRVIRKNSQFLLAGGLVVFSLYFSGVQLRSAWVQFIDQPRYISDEQILSTMAGQVDGQFFIDDDFGPTAVWYSGKNVEQLRDEALGWLFNKQYRFANVGKFVVITKQHRLDDLGIEKSRYKILKSDRDKILVQSL